jgi:hypothetical protein
MGDGEDGGVMEVGKELGRRPGPRERRVGVEVRILCTTWPGPEAR